MKNLTVAAAVSASIILIGFGTVAMMLRELDQLITPDMFDIEDDWDPDGYDYDDYT